MKRTHAMVLAVSACAALAAQPAFSQSVTTQTDVGPFSDIACDAVETKCSDSLASFEADFE